MVDKASRLALNLIFSKWLVKKVESRKAPLVYSKVSKITGCNTSTILL